MRRKHRRTTRADRKRRRDFVESYAGELVPIAVQRVRDVLAGSAPATVARVTGIARRQIQRLKAGKLARTHLNTLRALAEFRRIPVQELMEDSSRPPETAGEFLSFLRAREFLARWGLPLPISPQSLEALQFEACVRELFSYDAWVAELYPIGAPILEVPATISGRSTRLSVRPLQERRVRFAKSMADAIAVLLEPLDDIDASRLTVATHRALRSAAVSRIVFAIGNGLSTVAPGTARPMTRDDDGGLKRQLGEFHEAMRGRLRKRGHGVVADALSGQRRTRRL